MRGTVMRRCFKKMGALITMGGLSLPLILGGCATGPTEGQKMPMEQCTVTMLVNEGKAPEWLTKKGKAFSGDRKAFYGVGNAAEILNSALKRRAAESAARREVGAQLNTYVAGFQKQYMSDIVAGSLDQHSTEQLITDVMKDLTDATLVGVSIEEYWESPCRNESYALARVDLDQFLDKVKNYTSATEQQKELSEKIKQRVINNAEKAFEDLDKELNKRGQKS